MSFFEIGFAHFVLWISVRLAEISVLRWVLGEDFGTLIFTNHKLMESVV
jgi:hypothetical protein